MAEQIELKASVRAGVGKGAARAIRRDKLVPGVIYGDKKQAETIVMEYAPLWKQWNTGHFLSTVYVVDVEGKKTRVIPRDVQLDPVRDFIIHVDFLRIARGARIDVDVQVEFINEETCPGIKRGGSLNIVRHDVELNCPNDAIPESIIVDLAGYDIGDSIHISAVKLPANVKPVIQDRDFTIATIASPGGSTEDEGETTEAAAAEAEED